MITVIYLQIQKRLDGLGDQSLHAIVLEALARQI